ncbi:hypothetical protein MLD38_029095 [Melastoma candidum]|uniref:Uncharacterized protein n=1 Tax=Melastoma candidum TaxID=119954 RepID=A0ACB9N2R3_9MYRT|nr:hypothetical protein MLD38_029095 [Melastoma candidum]
MSMNHPSPSPDTPTSSSLDNHDSSHVSSPCPPGRTLRKIPPIVFRRKAAVAADSGDEAGCRPRFGYGSDGRNREGNSHQKASFIEQGKRVQWSQSKSFDIRPAHNHTLEANHVAFAKEIQSPRFQALLRLTSGRKKKTTDIKSFSHELNSKGVKPFPVWKPRSFAHMELHEIMVAVRTKFDKLKEEVDSDLGIFAGDLVSILEKYPESNSEWKESLEDLLIVASKCAKMSPDEFWVKCESIVQNLDDRRQELPMGILKQVHTPSPVYPH